MTPLSYLAPGDLSVVSSPGSAALAHLFGHLGWLLDWHLATVLHWNLSTVLLRHLATLLDWLLDWDLLAVLPGDLLALGHGLLDRNLNKRT